MHSTWQSNNNCWFLIFDAEAVKCTFIYALDISCPVIEFLAHCLDAPCSWWLGVSLGCFCRAPRICNLNSRLPTSALRKTSVDIWCAVEFQRDAKKGMLLKFCPAICILRTEVFQSAAFLKQKTKLELEFDWRSN